MPNFNGDVIFVDTSGQVRAQNGDLTLRADSTNIRDIIVGSGKSLRPDTDFALDLGVSFLRWKTIYGASGVLNVLCAPSSGTFVGLDDLDLIPLNNARRAVGSLTQRLARVHAASGIFNTVGAPTSGTFIESAASFVPNRTNIYALGTGSARWANIFSTSGNVLNIVSNDINTSTFTAGSATIDDLTLSNSLTFPQQAGGSFSINQIGSLTWDADGFDVAVINMTQWDWNQTNLVNVGTLNADTLSVNFNASVFGTLAVNIFEVTGGADILGMLETEHIRPQSDGVYAIGTSALRYARIHAASGLFNTIGPQTSGTFTNVIGSLVPEKTAQYALGTSSLRWGNVYATSGDITTLTSTSITSTDILATNSIGSLGSLQVLGVSFITGGAIFGSDAIPTSDAVQSFGWQGFRWRQMYMVSGFIETINPLTSGSFTTINGSFIPDQNATRALGTSTSRWGSINATSGVFNTISPPTSGTYLEVNGSLLPDRDLLYSLGTSTNRWATAQAGSGIFTTAATIKGAPVVTNKDARTTVHAVITANSGAIINANTERDIYNYTVPANTLSASGKLMLELVGSVTNMSASNVNFTPRVYVDGTNIWGDVFAVTQGPRPADFAFYLDICALGSLTGQRVRGVIELGTRTAGSVTGNGDFGVANVGGTWSSVATSGTANFSNPINIRVSMQLGTASTLASYSGFHCIMSHQPFPTL